MTLTPKQQAAIARKQRAARIKDLAQRRTRVGEIIMAVQALDPNNPLLSTALLSLDEYYGALDEYYGDLTYDTRPQRETWGEWDRQNCEEEEG